MLLETPYETELSGIDFDSLWNVIEEYFSVIPIDRWEFKKGKRFLQFYDKVFSRITPKNCKPWKLVITSKETTLSMDRLMQYDAEDVIKYLKERGMTACPMDV